MAEKDHSNPLTKDHHVGEEEFRTSKTIAPPSNHKNRSSKCLVYILLAVVLHSISFLVFGLFVLRINAPSLQLLNVAVRGLRYNTTSLNMTVIAEISLHNTNFGRFKFHGGSTTLWYENAIIGSTDIYDGRVGGRERTKIIATVKVIAGGSESKMNFSGDVGLGLVKVRSLGELIGEVRVVKIVNRRRTAVMNCTMDLNLTSQAVQGLSCQMKNHHL